MVSFRKKIQEQTGGGSPRQQGTYIAAGNIMEGQFKFTGPCVIAAKIRGRIDSDDLLIIEKDAVIIGDLHGSNIIIHGKVRGEVHAKAAVELGATADVEGVIASPGLKVAEGAQCKASMQITTKQIEGPATNKALPAPSAMGQGNVTPIDQAGVGTRPGQIAPAANANAPASQPSFLTAKI